MTEIVFILIGVVIIAIILRNRNKKNAHYSPSPKNINSNSKTDQESNEKTLYKNREIRRFDMKGMFYRDLSKNEIGKFKGYANCEFNDHDQYAVGIYNNADTLLGFVPKGNKRLNESIEEWHNGKVFSWGNLTYDEYNESWQGYVYIPVGLSEETIEEIKTIFKLIEKRDEIINKSIVDIEEYFSLLEDHKKIISAIESIKKPICIDYEFPKKLIPSLSKTLEQNKEWNKLIELEKYTELINNLSVKFSEATFKRIEKAKANLP
ncbi:MAG: hypothetical protein ACOCQ4_02670 [bacterium]